MIISTGILNTDSFCYKDDFVTRNRLVTSVYVGIDLDSEPIYDTRIINNYNDVTGLVFYEEK